MKNTARKLQNKRYRRGMSLLELLIYIAILSGLMVVVSSAFISLSKGRGQLLARNEVNSTIRFAVEKIRQDIKSASAASAPLSGAPESMLSVIVGGVPIIYDVQDGQLRRKEGAALPIAVTGSNVFVDTVNFARIENYNAIFSATTTAIQVAMTMRYNASSTDWLYSDSLRTTISLR